MKSDRGTAEGLSRRKWTRTFPSIPLIVRARLRSTQDLARVLVERRSVSVPFVLVASRQTAGRGRGANRWWSDAGSLCATFALPPPNMASGLVSLWAAWAVAETLTQWLPAHLVGIKWPNDIWIGSRKVAGILCERIRDADLIGIGVNIRTDFRRAPPELRETATSMAHHLRAPPTCLQVLVALGRRLFEARQMSDWIQHYRRHDLLLGRLITARVDDGEIVGFACGFDSEGRLILKTADGKRRVTEADVRLLRPKG